MDEKEVARQIESYFEDKGWEVYKEVPARSRGNIVDLYAIQGDPSSPYRSHAVEAKSTCSVRVIQQAEFWRGRAHQASIAVPWSDNRPQREFVSRICGAFGIGFFEVAGDGDVVRTRKPDIRRHGIQFPGLHEKQKEAVAGTDDPDERYTDLDRTLDRIRSALDGPVRLDTVIEETDHHYSSDTSAFRALKSHLRSGGAEDIQLLWQGAYVLKPTDTNRD